MDGGPNSRGPHPLLLTLAVVGGLTLSAVLVVIVLVGMAVNSVPDLRQAEKGYLDGQAFTSAIAGIRLEGEIDFLMADSVLDKLREAKDDQRVAGILLEINSPGGAVVPSQEIYDVIKEAKATKPVVAYVRDSAASGAYYAAASASKIIANRGSLIGSIGVIMSSVQTTQLLEWLKVKPVTLKTGKLKDAGSPTRDWTLEDREYLQGLIEGIHKQFVADVSSERELSEEAINFMADGRVVLGEEAQNLKLIDQLGGRELALDEIATIAKLESTPELIYMEDKQDFRSFFTQILENKFDSIVRQTLQSAWSGSLGSGDSGESPARARRPSQSPRAVPALQ